MEGASTAHGGGVGQRKRCMQHKRCISFMSQVTLQSHGVPFVYPDKVKGDACCARAPPSPRRDFHINGGCGLDGRLQEIVDIVIAEGFAPGGWYIDPQGCSYRYSRSELVRNFSRHEMEQVGTPQIGQRNPIERANSWRIEPHYVFIDPN